MANGRKPLSDDQKLVRDTDLPDKQKSVQKIDGIVAYGALEVEYERIFGQRRFSEYDSFRGSVTTMKSTGV